MVNKNIAVILILVLILNVFLLALVVYSFNKEEAKCSMGPLVYGLQKIEEGNAGVKVDCKCTIERKGELFEFRVNSKEIYKDIFRSNFTSNFTVVNMSNYFSGNQ